MANDLVSLAKLLSPADASPLLSDALAKEADAWTCRVLAEGLASVAGQLPPAEAAAVCALAARRLAEEVKSEKGEEARQNLASGLAAVAGRLTADNVVRLLGEAADSWTRLRLAETLATMAERLPPDNILLLAEALGKELAKPGDAWTRYALANDLASVAGRLPPADAGRVCAPAVRLLAETLPKLKDDEDLQNLAQSLMALAMWLPPEDAARLLAPGARFLVEALAKVKYAIPTVQMLVTTAERLEGSEEESACYQALAILQQREADAADNYGREDVQDALSWLVRALAEEKAHRVAIEHARQIAASRDMNFYYKGRPHILDVLDRFLTVATPLHRYHQAVAAATAVGLASSSRLPALVALPAGDQALPCRLSTPELVELLKYPTCFGEARKVVLKHLGNRYGRTFANHWEFVRFAKEQQLDLDLTSPPKRWRGRR